MRDLLLVVSFFPMLPFAFLYPWIGILMWCWISYMNPHRLTYGFAYDLPFAMITAVTTLAGLLLSRERKRLPRSPEVFLMFFLWFWTTVTSVFAVHPQLGWDKWMQVSKIFLMTVVTMLLFRDAGRLKWLVWVIAASLGYFGVKSAIGALGTGFQGGLAYPPDSFLGDNNDLALALNMTLPLLWLLAKDQARRWIRYGLRIAFCLTVVGILATYSRAGFLTLCVVLIVMFTKARAKAAALAILLIAVMLGMLLLPDTYFDRIGTIAAYEEDASAQGRLAAWAVAVSIALDSPIVGAGFRAFEHDIWQRYDPTGRKAAVAHSSYFQMLGEHGFVGLAIFLALLGWVYVGLRRTRARAARTGHPWVGDLASALQTCVVAYIVGGAFLSRADFDLFYSMVAMSAALQSIVPAEDQPEAEPAGAGLDRSVGWGDARRVTG